MFKDKAAAESLCLQEDLTQTIDIYDMLVEINKAMSTATSN